MAGLTQLGLGTHVFLYFWLQQVFKTRTFLDKRGLEEQQAQLACGQRVLSIAFLCLGLVIWKCLVPGKRGGIGSCENCKRKKKMCQRVWTGLWASSPKLEGLWLTSAKPWCQGLCLELRRHLANQYPNCRLFFSNPEHQPSREFCLRICRWPDVSVSAERRVPWTHRQVYHL